ncbi:PD-(D/E)XK nuclease domain-containing protein [Psychrobacter celer]|uniref:PD-(D/E)XK nuclease domain-containing protein n=1 Tax=Psychrobacter celer TaxID=306572 RepID=UPI003FD2450B
MEKSKAIKKLEKLIERAEPLKNSHRFEPDFEKWKRDTAITIDHIFGKDSNHKREFSKIGYSLLYATNNTTNSERQAAYEKGISSATIMLQSMRDEVQEFWSETESDEESSMSANTIVELIINRFHQVARQLRHRYNNRATLDIDDEYDVQDLFHALLKLYFDDVRPEEYTPSYAGAASRTDFLLKKEQVIIELKKSRKTLRAKEVGEQLIIDSQRYQAHPDCKRIICFVYDPEGLIANPKGIENDLSKEMNGIPVSVFIRPE